MEVTMNTTDMYTREKAAQERQAAIEQHIQTTTVLRQAGIRKAPAWPRLLLIAGGVVAALLLAGLLIAFTQVAGTGISLAP
jgi:uncharacterized protein involved in exopolysaccharide biosynthesis